MRSPLKLSILAIFLVGLGAAAWMWSRAAATPSLTILYTRGLGGMLESADDPRGAALSDVAAVVRQARAQAETRGERVVLMDLGDSLTGLGAVNAFHRGLPMAEGMRAAGYDAVLPSERDLWLGIPALEAAAQAGQFRVLLANVRREAAPATWSRPLLCEMGSHRVAIFGVYAAPHIALQDDEAYAFTHNLDLLRAAIKETKADFTIVAARVADPISLAQQLPEASLILPASAIPQDCEDAARAQSLARLAPQAGEGLGSITLTVDREKGIVASTQLGPTPRASDAAVASAAQPWRTRFASASKDNGQTRMRAFAPVRLSRTETAAALADAVRDDLEVDVCLIAASDVQKGVEGLISDAALQKCVRSATVSVHEWSGRALEEKLRASSPWVASGLARWEDAVLLNGLPLASAKRLRVAVSSSLLPGTGAPLIALVQDALVTRPLLDTPPQRAFSGNMRDAATLLSAGLAKARADHRKQADDLFVEALCRSPHEATAQALLETLQALDPWAPPSYRHVAELHERAGNWRLAWDTYGKARAAYPAAWYFAAAQARLAIRCHAPQAVPALLEAAAAAPPAELRLLAGHAALAMGDAPGAAALLDEALEQTAPAGSRWLATCRALSGLANFRAGAPGKTSKLSLETRP